MTGDQHFAWDFWTSENILKEKHLQLNNYEFTEEEASILAKNLTIIEVTYRAWQQAKNEPGNRE